MAKAIATESRETVTVTREIPGVRLTLTPHEAVFLARVLAKIGGDPTKSQRRYSDSIAGALRSAGVTYKDFTGRDINGNLYCFDEV